MKRDTLRPKCSSVECIDDAIDQTNERQVERKSDTLKLKLDSERPASIRLEGFGDITLRSSDGSAQIDIVWGKKGAQVHLREADLVVEKCNDIQLDCENFRVNANCDVEIEAQRKLKLRSQVVEAIATLGDMLLRANDFMRVTGERVLLNTDLDPEESDRKAKEFLAKLLGRRL